MRKQTTFKRITWNKKSISAILVLGLLLFATFTIAFKVEPVSAVSPTPVPLGTASYFSVLPAPGSPTQVQPRLLQTLALIRLPQRPDLAP